MTCCKSDNGKGKKRFRWFFLLIIIAAVAMMAG
jgi:hypothetical protein